jgi:cystathionine beta-lyase/cystathionine gamma-synthase
MQIWGQALDPFAAWLIDRGMRTLGVRMDRHNATGLAVAEWLSRQRGVTAVHYPGLRSHVDHQLASRILGGYGGMVGVELKGGARAAERFLRALRIVTHAPSLGGVETLVSEPRITSHVSLTAEQRAEAGIPDPGTGGCGRSHRGHRSGPGQHLSDPARERLQGVPQGRSRPEGRHAAGRQG